MGILFSLWQTFFRDEFSYSFRNVKPKSRTRNIMIWNKQIILPFQQVFHHASCRSSSYLQSWTTSFPHNWFMMIICPQKGCQLHSSCLLLSGNLLLGDNEQPCFPPKPVATEWQLKTLRFWEQCLKPATDFHAVVQSFLWANSYGLHGILLADCCQCDPRRFKHPGIIGKQVKGISTSQHTACILRLFPCSRGSTATVHSFKVSTNGLWASFPHSCVFSAAPHLDPNTATDGGVQQLKTSGARECLRRLCGLWSSDSFVHCLLSNWMKTSNSSDRSHMGLMAFRKYRKYRKKGT